MARPLRIDQVGGWYHVTARGNERRPIFRDDRDRQHFLELLEGAVAIFALRLHAYVLMSNHYHLLIELTEPNLSRAAHWLNVSYTVWFNRRHNRDGHLFQGRFKSVLVDPQEWALRLSRYVHLNPVRVKRLGLSKAQVRRSRSVGVESLDREQVRKRLEALRSYPWSSYRAYLGSVRKPDWLTTTVVLEMGGTTRGAARKYRQYCEVAVREGLADSPWDQVVGQMVLGTERFVEKLAKRMEQKKSGARAVRPRVGLKEIIKAVEQVRGEKWEDFRDRYGDAGRDLVLYLGRRWGGLKTSELSVEAGIAYQSAATAVRRFSERLTREVALRRLLEEALTQLNKE